MFKAIENLLVQQIHFAEQGTLWLHSTKKWLWQQKANTASFKGQGSQGSQGSQGAIVCNAAEGMSAVPGRERVGREARVDLRAQDGHRGPCDEESEESEELGRHIHVA